MNIAFFVDLAALIIFNTFRFHFLKLCICMRESKDGIRGQGVGVVNPIHPPKLFQNSHG